MRIGVRTLFFTLLVIVVAGLHACVPEADEMLRLHDLAIYSNARDLQGLYGYLYGKPQSLVVGGNTVILSEASFEDTLAVPSALAVGDAPYLKQNLPNLSPPPTRVQYVPLSSDVELEVGSEVGEVVYFDGDSWFTLVADAQPGMKATIVPRLRVGGLQGVGELTREEAEALEETLRPRAPVAVMVIPEPTLANRRIDGLGEYRRTALYVQQTVPTNAAAYTPPARDLVWEVLAGGNQAVGVEQPEYLLITNEGELLSVWNRAYGAQLTVPPLPEVDFRRETILAVFMGQKPSGGYSIDVQDAALEASDIYVDVIFNEPAAGAMTTQALTSPWVILRVLRGDVNAGWFRNPNTAELYGVARRFE